MCPILSSMELWVMCFVYIQIVLLAFIFVSACEMNKLKYTPECKCLFNLI